MKMLFIDTSLKDVSIATYESSKLLSVISECIPNMHSIYTIPYIDRCLTESKIDKKEVEKIIVINGPGSFTGIRIGISTVKAIAESLNIPVVAVSSLEGLAYNINSSECICSLIDARNNQVYCGLFDSNHTLIGNYMADDINAVLKVINQAKNVTFVGDGAVAHKDLLNISDFKSDNLLHAKNINLCAFDKFSKGEILNADSILPMYLRKSQAERMRNLNG